MEEEAAPQLSHGGGRQPGVLHPQPLPLLSLQPGHGAGQRALLHPLLPLLHLELGRLAGAEAYHHLGVGDVPGAVHQGCHPLAAACLPARGEAGSLLQLRVQHALHPRHVGHRHPPGAPAAQLRPLAGNAHLVVLLRVFSSPGVEGCDGLDFFWEGRWLSLFGKM